MRHRLIVTFDSNRPWHEVTQLVERGVEYALDDYPTEYDSLRIEYRYTGAIPPQSPSFWRRLLKALARG